MPSVVLQLRNRAGLHARPAAQFVQTAARFQSQITVRSLTRQSAPVNAKAILSVLTLGAEQGHEIEVTAEGTDASEALEALRHLIEDVLPQEDAE